MSWHATALTAQDNVATLLEPVSAGSSVVVATPSGLVEMTARQDIAMGHKIALADLATGERVIKYGAAIGVASAPIASGDWVHIHNLRSQRAQQPESGA